ncbi:MAG: exodeoxyribonuclease VII small subunit [Bacteroidales bacterium]|nr:exodeoxyribonuclease VII small subunit [Lentimicrobiaceae bacterium]MDD5694653.1 exodeoxyribonuclease VII small subunit [Bacteroidales bacterium]
MKNYTNALKEIEKIVDELERGDVPVDILVARVKRASELISQCKALLKETSQEVEGVLGKMNGESQPE